MSLAGRRALVTGAGGFIGSHLVVRLGGEGCEVMALSRHDRAREPGGPLWRRVDLIDPVEVGRAFAAFKPDLVVHLASQVTGSRDLDLVLPTLRANLLTTVTLLASAAEVGCGRVLLAGSMEEPEATGAEPVPRSPYAAAKWAAAGYARMFHALYRLPVVLLRLFMVYGPGQRDLTKLVPYVTLSLLRGEAPRLSSGRRPIDWIFVEDVVDALVAAAQAPGIEGRTFDVGSGRVHTIRTVVEELVRLTGAGVEPLFGALPDRPLESVSAANVDETASRLGWRARTGLEEGLARTVDWYRESTSAAAAPQTGRTGGG